ncbi:PASTA domain-containing protein [Leifsonia sp. 71-9]|uniref:PASTA domain-containing protein n=1 Tax=Leifsonia sp. 71-9 TaxID=1895934 RepID=UPI0009266A14|nr:PASTA domain-containing protein [Leifsonia sp. 71-9]OJX75301.1 MAG: hypothetical protein BGO91_18525 [Leifsonia sp. 71-9]
MNGDASIPRGRERYTALRPLGADAFSITSVARDGLLDRDVALTELRPELADDAVAARIVAARIASAADLSVPGVPEVFDHGGGRAARPWVVTALVAAPTVQDLVADGRSARDAEELLAVARTLAETMREVNAGGVVHGALGPDIVLLEGARTWVTGLGPQPWELLSPSDPAGTAEAWSRFTASLRFASPEQAAGEAPGRRSDVYGFGRVLESLLVLGERGEDAPPVVAVRLLGALQRLRESCVDPTPARRPASFAAVLGELERIEAAARPPRESRPEDVSAWPTAALATITTVHPQADADAVATERIRIVRGRPATPATATATAGAGAARSARSPKRASGPGSRPRPRRPWSPAARLVVAGAAVLVLTAAVVAHALLVPAGSAPDVVVPQVAGKTVEEAARTLTASGAVVAGQHPTASSYGAGLVSGTDPGPGTSISAGQTVALLVSTGPGETPVPQLAGLDVAGARDALAASGLTLGAISARDGVDRAGAVLGTAPSFGARVPEGTAIDLVIASGRVRVPAGLTGQASQPVIDALAAAGLHAQTVTQDTSEFLTGVVLRVEPGEGARLALGGIVTLTVARYVPPPAPPPTDGPVPTPSATADRTPVPVATP